ncbi:hypothetical protein M436DRAFT_59325 [Aureobasidium namibiae CBS 147.97]|uniref:Uncharacterized protein n=1 Tax=Aureobasidium namibiae CBS 147.97 TaxID=1043004 RepID=A0A074X0M3_9PEZI
MPFGLIGDSRHLVSTESVFPRRLCDCYGRPPSSSALISNIAHAATPTLCSKTCLSKVMVRSNSEWKAYASSPSRHASHSIRIPDRHDLPQTTMDNKAFSIRLRQRIALDAQQEYQVPEQHRPGRQRPYGIAELRRLREDAVARETDYNRGLIARNDKRRQARFRLDRQHAIFWRLHQWLLPRGA